MLAACSPQGRDPLLLRSGDTVELVHANRGDELVLAKDEHRFRVRLAGVYAFHPGSLERPEVMRLAAEARRLVEDRGRDAGLRLVLEIEERDPKGRFIGYLEAAGRDLGRLLIEERLAMVYTEFPFSREDDYVAAEGEARRSATGIWDPDNFERLRSLRAGWSAARSRRFGAAPADPLLAEGR